MIDERSREFMIVRKISKEYENVTKNLDRNAPCLVNKIMIFDLILISKLE